MDDVNKGLLFSLCGNVAINVGHHLKGHGENRNGAKAGEKLIHGKILSSSTLIDRCLSCISKKVIFWVIGYFLFVSGSVSNAYALAFAPQTLLASMGSVQFIVNLFCTAFFHNTQIRKAHLFGTLCVVGGCIVMVVGFNPRDAAGDENNTSIVDLYENFNRKAYRSYLAVVFSVFMASVVWQRLEPCLCPSPKSGSAMGPQMSKKSSRRAALWTVISGVVYCVFSAMPGSQSVVLGKALAIIVRRSISGQIDWSTSVDVAQLFFVCIVAVAWFVTISYWLYRQHDSTVKFSPVFIVPLNQVAWITFSTISGGLYFREFQHASSLQWASLICGLLLIYSGLFNLVHTHADNESDANSTATRKNMDKMPSVNDLRLYAKHMEGEPAIGDTSFGGRKKRKHLYDTSETVPLIRPMVVDSERDYGGGDSSNQNHHEIEILDEDYYSDSDADALDSVVTMESTFESIADGAKGDLLEDGNFSATSWTMPSPCVRRRTWSGVRSPRPLAEGSSTGGISFDMEAAAAALTLSRAKEEPSTSCSEAESEEDCGKKEDFQQLLRTKRRMQKLRNAKLRKMESMKAQREEDEDEMWETGTNESEEDIEMMAVSKSRASVRREAMERRSAERVAMKQMRSVSPRVSASAVDKGVDVFNVSAAEMARFKFLTDEEKEQMDAAQLLLSADSDQSDTMSMSLTADNTLWGIFS